MTMQEIRAMVMPVMEKLEKNNMTAYFVETKEEVPALMATLVQKGESLAFGGSMSLNDCGVMEWARCGDYQVVDRYAPGLTREEIQEVFRQSFLVDHYLCSTNAVTEGGVLYNVDGNGNRVAAMMFGPKSVILVVGYQKIVKDLDAAKERVRTVASPKNCQRLNCTGTYCYHKGQCIACGKEIPAGCGANSICHDFTVMGRQTIPGRIKVIFVGEEVGY